MHERSIREEKTGAFGSGWSVNVHRQDGNTLSLQVHIPASAQVGIWRCSVQTNFQGQREGHRKDYKVFIY